MPENTLPISLADLDPAELYRSALEDFALPVDKDDNKESLLAAFFEGGVTFNDYAGQHPEVLPPTPVVAAPVDTVQPVAATPAERTPEPTRPGVITLDGGHASSLTVEPQAVPVVPEQAAPVVRVAEAPKYSPQDKLLVKMHQRDNPSFGFRQYTFTQQNPYVLMNPADGEDLISTEPGFRMALPSELREFYG